MTTRVLRRVRALPRESWGRLRPDLVPFAQGAIAAGVAWQLARLIHSQPIFAPISALISMRAAVGRRGDQAVQMIIGITLGIVIAEALVRGLGSGGWELGVAVLVGMAIPAAVGMPPLVVTQSAVWCILVVALGPHSTSYAIGRFVDGLIGGGVALVFVRFLFPADPHRLIARAARPVYGEVADILDQIGDALDKRDEERARDALGRVERFDDRRLRDAIETGRDIVRRAPRRRNRRALLEPYNDAAQELDAIERNLTVLAVAAVRRVREREPVPLRLVDAVHRLALAYRALPERLDPTDRDPVAPALDEVEATLQRTEPRDGFASTMLHQQLEALARDARRATAEREEAQAPER